MEEDIVELITAFDNFLDNMYDRGAFDTTNQEDKELEDYINVMKKKYLKRNP